MERCTESGWLYIMREWLYIRRTLQRERISHIVTNLNMSILKKRKEKHNIKVALGR